MKKVDNTSALKLVAFASFHPYLPAAATSKDPATPTTDHAYQQMDQTELFSCTRVVEDATKFAFDSLPPSERPLTCSVLCLTTRRSRKIVTDDVSEIMAKGEETEVDVTLKMKEAGVKSEEAEAQKRWLGSRDGSQIGLGYSSVQFVHKSVSSYYNNTGPGRKELPSTRFHLTARKWRSYSEAPSSHSPSSSPPSSSPLPLPVGSRARFPSAGSPLSPAAAAPSRSASPATSSTSDPRRAVASSPPLVTSATALSGATPPPAPAAVPPTTTVAPAPRPTLTPAAAPPSASVGDEGENPRSLLLSGKERFSWRKKN
ncbi:hypothetical protein ZIOFF_060384 [Zingiber officinale]|uniref:Uncharacterized protein n=1 Tax=Zingiber officinale TaxID=94328 RepID=A0A8J5F8M1_ZINOF|nr:hypothetical protein ZIOFF_060384 [Zingiber officinale]